MTALSYDHLTQRSAHIWKKFGQQGCKRKHANVDVCDTLENSDLEVLRKLLGITDHIGKFH